MYEEYFEYLFNNRLRYGKKTMVWMMVGSFYEMYARESDQESIIHLKNVSNILGFTVTKRNNNIPVSDSNPYMSGFPTVVLSKNLARVLQHNYTIVIVEQFDSCGQKQKSRKVEKIYSPSTYIEDETVDNNILSCIYIHSWKCPISKKILTGCSISSIDLGVGKSYVYSCEDNDNNTNIVKNEVRKYIHTFNPCELILICKEENLISDYDYEFRDKLLLHKKKEFDKKYTDMIYLEEYVKKLFGSNEFISPSVSIGITDKDSLSTYVYLIDFAYDHDPNIIQKIHKPTSIIDSKNLHYNNDSLIQLNLVDQEKYTSSTYSSLFSVLNNTQTAMGKRLLRNILLHPITDIEELNNRYNKITKVLDTYKKYIPILKNIPDIERKFRKIQLQKISPDEFYKLYYSFLHCKTLLDISKEDFYTENYDDLIINFNIFLEDISKTFNIELMKNCTLQDIPNSFFNQGIDENIDIIDKKIRAIQNIKEKILTEINDKNSSKAKFKFEEKDNYIYLITTKNAWNNYKKEHSTIFSLKDKEYKCELFEVEQMKSNNVKIKCDFFEKISKKLESLTIQIHKLVLQSYINKLIEYENCFGNVIQNIIDKIAEIDLFTNFAYVSTKFGYTCPKIIDNNEEKSYVEITGLRHPIIERIQEDKEYITNDVSIGKDKYGMLLYGINSSGKSSFLRAIGTNIILAQIGMYVSSSSFTFYPYRKLLTKISTIDNLFKGQSTFIVEMNELKDILLKVSPHTLVLCDELTAGTEIDSSTGIVLSTVDTLLSNFTNFVFTTHLHSLLEFPEITEHSKLDIFHFNLCVNGGNVNYERKLIKGPGERMYGIEIAQALGLDSKFIQKAYQYRNKYIGEDQTLLQDKRSRYNRHKIVDKCENCGSKENLHTHHKLEQKMSDDKGMIGHFHKNTLHNLMILCEKCHIHHHHK
jgi:DNA mismatch repair protein MutS